jgi:hypothetical protein
MVDFVIYFDRLIKIILLHQFIYRTLGGIDHPHVGQLLFSATTGVIFILEVVLSP